jgi:UDP-glucose 4-epimerase
MLTLNQAVDTVFAALQSGKPGDIFVPRAPSSLMTDVAKALIGNRAIELKVTGIRPGEKMYEIMVSDEEAPYVVSRGDYFVIQSMLPELAMHREKIKTKLLSKEYSSADTVLDSKGTYELLKQNGLLNIQMSASSDQSELLR